jgi:hypothetical protein
MQGLGKLVTVTLFGSRERILNLIDEKQSDQADIVPWRRPKRIYASTGTAPVKGDPGDGIPISK